VKGLPSNAIDVEIFQQVAVMIPDWNFEVFGQGGSIHVRVWNDDSDQFRDVNPVDYIAHADPWARRNPMLAPVLDGIRVMVDLPPTGN
jgi:hypothetical protein